MHRRTLLKASAGSVALPAIFLGLAGTGLSGCQSSPDAQTIPSGSQATPHSLDEFGLQLSTVTDLMLADFEGTLETVAKIGYRQVEFGATGFLGRSAADVQSLLKELSLEAPVGRVIPRLPENFFTLPRADAIKIYFARSEPEYVLENVKRSLESAAALSQRYLVLPALAPGNFKSLDLVKRNIELMNRAGELCAEQGVVFGYHNHNWELLPIEGVVPYDLMLRQTEPKKVTFQLDTYWIRKGGGDLSDYLTRFAGRFSTCHLKDIDSNGDFADVGHGLIDFPRFTREALAQGAKLFFVERDNPPEPRVSVVRSFVYLRKMTF